MTTPHSTAPSQIQQELDKIWDSLAEAHKSRASLFNLIFYTQKNKRADYVHTVAHKVIERFPSRIFYITADKSSSKSELKTQVSVLPAGKGEYGIACDLIEIEASGSEIERIPFLLLPHLLSDLPVYLICAEDPTESNPIMPQLEKLATRLIFDSESADHLPRFAKAILAHQKNSHADIADLNWARFETWRDLIVATFNTSAKLAIFDNLKTIEIAYNAHETPFFCHTKIQAVYLQTWLASQLEWSFKKLEKGAENELRFSYTKGKNEIETRLTPAKHDHLAPGIILSVDLTTNKNDHFSFRRNLKMPQQISMTYSSQQQCDIPLNYLFAKAESGQSLVREICHKGTSAHFLKVLDAIISMGEKSPLC